MSMEATVDRRWPGRSLAVAAVVVLAAALPGLFPVLVYDRALVLQGEIWRLVSGQLVHAGRAHLVWDVLPLLGVGILFESSLERRYWRTLALSALLVGGGLAVLAPGLNLYCGLSGALNGLWVGGALTGARREDREGSPRLALLYRICVVADLAKIAWEAGSGTPLFSDPVSLGAEPVVLAHALGALGGALPLLVREPGGRGFAGLPGALPGRALMKLSPSPPGSPGGLPGREEARGDAAG